MAIQPTDPIKAMTNAQCAQLRDEIVALLALTGIADPTVRRTKKILNAGIDYLLELKDQADQKILIDQNNTARLQRDISLSAIDQRRIARKSKDYGDD